MKKPKRSKRPKRRRNYIWVVEGEFGWGWQSTPAVGVTRIEATEERRSWAAQNPSDRFRIVKYEAVR